MSMALVAAPTPDVLVPVHPEEELGLAGRIVGSRYVAPASWRDDEASIAAWLADGEVIQEIEKRVGFWLGDWARQGLELFGQGKWSQAMRESGHALQTVKNASSTAKMFPATDRIYENVSYSHYVTAKDLPIEVAHEMLAGINARPPSVSDFRDMVAERKRQLRISELQALPAPVLNLDDMSLFVGDARQLPIPDESVDAIVTSPPYALEKDYHQAGDVSPLTWWQFTRDWMAEAFRVAKVGARMLVNVPIDTSQPFPRPTSAEATAAAIAAGWTYKTQIVWLDDQMGSSLARGSVDSATSPNVYAPVEVILVFFKGDAWGRDPEGKPSDIDHDDWLKWTNGFWQFPGESSPWEWHPAAFPLELPRRLLHVFTFAGDVILDPFLGSGTTAVACVKWNRKCVGVDLSPFFVASTKRRLLRAVA